MSDAKRERRGHFRGKPRPGRRVEVRYRLIEQGQLSAELRAFTKNIGVGGAFIVTDHSPEVGTPLQVLLSVPASSRPIEVRAEVRWTAASDDSAERGFGVKFNGLDVDQLLALNDYFASLTATVDHDEA
jgi:uncharacterized protein (TIGR02266 family)